MLNSNLPNMFNTKLIKSLEPISDSLLNNVQTKEDEPAGILFNCIKKDPDLNFLETLETNSLSSERGFKIDAKKVELYSKIIYDYYRKNTFQSKEDSDIKNSDVFLSEVKEFLTRIQFNSFDTTMTIILEKIKSFEISKDGIKIKGKPNLVSGLSPEQCIAEFEKMFKDFLNNHYAFIELDYKIKSFNKLFKEVKKLNTEESLKASMLIHFYDLVYAISIVTNFVDYKNACKIIS